MPYHNHNLVKIERLLKSKKAIKFNNKLVKLLGFDDMRDFFEDIHSWGHSRDFTYQTTQDDMQKFIRAYIRENFLD